MLEYEALKILFQFLHVPKKIRNIGAITLVRQWKNLWIKRFQG
jgi:hypothetical protein